MINIEKEIVNELKELQNNNLIENHTPGYPSDFNKIPCVDYKVTLSSDIIIKNREKILNCIVYYNIWGKNTRQINSIFNHLNIRMITLGFVCKLNENIDKSDDKYKRKTLRYEAKVDIETGDVYNP